MKKRPQSLSAVNRTDSVDKKLAGGLLALALIGGTGVTTYAADANRGGILLSLRQVHKSIPLAA